ncbi:MAG TPA: FG-GAP-like repeat-containing protein [Verrucomicrobiae bacterium]|jgi:hypothetical protein
MSFRFAIALIVTCLVVAVFWEFSRPRQVPIVAPPQHKMVVEKETPTAEAIGSFYVGISALDVGDNERAGRMFDELSKKLSNEPAIWANLGLARLRLGDIPGAEEAFATAAKLSPTNAQIVVLQAIVDDYQGKYPEAITRLRGLPNPDVTVLYRLAQLLDRSDPDAEPREQLEIYDRIQKLQPNNLVAAFSRARLVARTDNKDSLTAAINHLESYRAGWGTSAIQQCESAKTAAAAGNFKAAATDLAFLQNLNLATPAYQAALSALGVSSGSLGEPIRGFLAHHEPENVIPAADESLAFEMLPDAAVSPAPDFYLAEELSTNSRPNILSLANGKLGIRNSSEIPLPALRGTLSRNSFCVADLNGDGLEDLAFADGNGLKIWMQSADGKFSEYQPNEAIRPVFNAPCHGVWAVDYDADGDLDLIVARDGAAPQLLRNNGDGNFTAVDALAPFPEIRDVCWGDFDGDGTDDLAILDVNGRALVSWNNRSGAFSVPAPISESPVAAIALGDVIGTGETALIVLNQNGAIENLTFDREKRTWTHRELAHWTNPPDLADAFKQSRANIFVADMDNNGAPDIIASAANSSSIWLNQGKGRFQNLHSVPSLFVTSIADTDGDGLLDLVGLSATNAAIARTHGTKGYHWQTIQVRTQGNVGDGRVNNFGIGGRIEIRAGRLVAAAPIISPRTHFGLGDQNQVGAARIVWPNGVAQVEFDLQSDQDITAVQRLKGSCPWVFAKDGDKFNFVKDFIWRSPLGMRINSEDTAGIDQTEDWILLPGKFLTADSGAYEIRITAELWETHFFDHIAMKVVDHPESVAAFVDERFVPTKQPKLEVICATPPQPFAQAYDQSGHDVLKALAATDGDYVTNFPLGRFQGLTTEHWIEFELPQDAPVGKPLVLVGDGWIYPTDSSLNVAISQGTNSAPHGLVLEDYDAKKGWQTVSGDLGFPAGKNKIVVIPLPRKSLQSGHRRFRLRTNLEVYWDRLGWAIAKPDAEINFAPAEIVSAELRYRGFSKLATPGRRRPDVPIYDKLSGAGARWRDLEGYYTRYGDVRELLRETDDRYVIMNAGDEMVLRFAAPPPPSNGWTRDFVLIGDGWVKDGDFNTANSRTVGPLPSHSMKHYGGPTQPLDDDPIFQHNTDDWQRFQTRYVTPTAFDRGLMNGANARLEGAPQ